MSANTTQAHTDYARTYCGPGGMIESDTKVVKAFIRKVAKLNAVVEAGGFPTRSQLVSKNAKWRAYEAAARIDRYSALRWGVPRLFASPSTVADLEAIVRTHGSI